MQAFDDRNRVMTDWQHITEMLLEESEPFVRALLGKTSEEGETLAAIGYTFEFGSGQLCFEMCANTASNAKESLAQYLAESPDASTDECRWNSGDYDYPGAVQEEFGDWSPAWWDELSQLDQLSADEGQSKIIHARMADICCEVLAELATRGIFEDWSVIDFNVAALLDDVELVKQRDAQIKGLIASNAEPNAAPDGGE